MPFPCSLASPPTSRSVRYYYKRARVDDRRRARGIEGEHGSATTQTRTRSLSSRSRGLCRSLCRPCYDKARWTGKPATTATGEVRAIIEEIAGKIPKAIRKPPSESQYLRDREPEGCGARCGRDGEELPGHRAGRRRTQTRSVSL